MLANARQARHILKNEGLTVLIQKTKEYLIRKANRSKKRHISLLKGQENLVVAEVGVWRGNNAEYLTKNLDIEEIYLIDPYNTYEDYNSKTDVKKMRSARNQAHRKMQGQANVNWIEKYSYEAVEDINRKLDYVYIDGNHSYEYVRDDLNNYYPLLKEGGILAGDDMDWDGVSQAIIEFAVNNSLQLYLEPYHPDWYFIKGEVMESDYNVPE
jgi:predicted O-methyltransferase YrrM